MVSWPRLFHEQGMTTFLAARGRSGLAIHGRAAVEQLSRRDALWALAAGAAGLSLGCGSTARDLEGGAAGSPGSGGSGGAGASGTTGGSAGLAGSSGVGGASGMAGAGGSSDCPTPGCLLTDDNILGPFYKEGAPMRADLTAEIESGQLLIVEGRVTICDCTTPLPDAEVDVWQADDAGAYDDISFRLRGKMRTDGDGNYQLTTILPGRYLNGSTYRPSHVHYIVRHPDAVALTTQLYFEGDPFIPTDAFVVPSLVMPLVEEPQPDGTTLLRTRFDIVLPRV